MFGISFSVRQGKRTKTERIFLAVLCGLFTAVGLGMAAYGLMLLVEARQSLGWPTTDGRITRSEVVRLEPHEGERFQPKIRYSYEVDGVSYQGTRFSFDWHVTKRNRNRARRIAARYPVHQVVDVFYDPAEPASATLEPGIGRATLLWLAGGLAFAVFGSSVVLLALPSTSGTPQPMGCAVALLFPLLIALAAWTMS